MIFLPPDRLRPARLLWWLCLALGGAFLALLLVVSYFGRQRHTVNENLLAELADATLVEDPVPTPEAWPQWRGLYRDGVGSLPGIPRQWPGRGPKRLWSINPGSGYSSFAVRDNRAYSMFSREGNVEVVACLDLADGKELWTYPHTITSLPSGGYEGTRATPSLDGEKLYSVCSDGLFLCLDLTGKLLWSHDLVKELGARAPRWGFSFSPLVHGQLVYLSPGGTAGRSLAAYHKDTGELAWTSQDDPPGYSSPIAATIGGVPQIIFFTGNRLLGVDPQNGNVLWRHPWYTNHEVNAATPVLLRARSEGNELTYVFISSGYGTGCGLFKIDHNDKQNFRALPVYTSNELYCHFASPVRKGDHVYALDETRDLTCMNLRTGKIAWRFSRDEEDTGLRAVNYKKGTLIRVEDLLIVLGEDGKLAMVEADPTQYRELAASRPFRDVCWTLPVLADGRLLVRDRRQVICFDLRSSQ